MLQQAMDTRQKQIRYPERTATICVRQAEIIKEQAYVLEQFGAQVREEEALAARNRLQELGCLDD